MASFSICETTSFEVQTRDIRIPLRGLSITKQMLLLQFSVRMMYSTKEKSFSQRFHIRYLEKSEWSLINQNKVQWFAVTNGGNLFSITLQQRTLVLRTSTSTRLNLKFLHVFSKKKGHPRKLHFTVFHLKLWDSYLYWRRLSPLLLAK